MLSNEQQMDLLKQAAAEKYNSGTILELFQANDPEFLQAQAQQQGQGNVQVAETPEQQQQGMSGMAPEQMPDAMVFPQSQGDFNTMNMQAPVNVDKYGPEGELVRSYESVPPGVGNLPMGDDIGTVIETPAEYKKGGFFSNVKAKPRKTGGFFNY